MRSSWKIRDTARNFRWCCRIKQRFGTTTVDTEYHSETTCLDKRHCYNVINSTRIQQIENYKSPAEHELPPDQGFLWRLHSIQRYEERDGGVYAELESIALTRTVPFDLLWLLKPIYPAFAAQLDAGNAAKDSASCVRR